MTLPLLAPLSHLVAELTVPPRPSAFGLRTAGSPAVHEVGVHGAPRWKLRQPLSPDDAWELETLPTGKLLSAKRTVPEELEWAYLTWAEGTRAESGAAVLWALPPGRYLLVRSGRALRAEPQVLLGNERVAAPANARVLIDERPFYGLALGHHPAAAPGTASPLLGVAVLNYVGSWTMSGVLFFDCVPRQGDAVAEPSGDLVLVVPAQGDLVIDALAEFSAKHSAQSMDDWARGGALRFAEALCH